MKGLMGFESFLLFSAGIGHTSHLRLDYKTNKKSRERGNRIRPLPTPPLLPMYTSLGLYDLSTVSAVLESRFGIFFTFHDFKTA